MSKQAMCVKCHPSHPVPVQRTANGRYLEGTHGGCRANVNRSTIGEGTKPSASLLLRQQRHDQAASAPGTIPVPGGFKKTSGDGAGQTFHRPGSNKK
jgi:hypothetical protein